MGNCCSSGTNNDSLDRMSIPINNAIINSNIVSLLKENLENPNINEANYIINLYKNNDSLECKDILRYMFIKRLLPELKKITESKNYHLIISLKIVNNALLQGANYNFDFTKTVTTKVYNIPIINESMSDGTPDVYNKSKTLKLPFYIKIIKDIIGSDSLNLHQYDKDIIYQTPTKKYYRSNECIICYERQANVLYLGCMHLQLCDKCHTNTKDPNYNAKTKGRWNCPICETWTGYKSYDWFILDSETLESNYPITTTGNATGF